MLSFLAPLFLAGAAAAAVPIVLHLLKREPEDRVKFAPVKLIRQAPVEHTDRRRLRELLLLALRVAALLLLAFAFARPFLNSSASAAASGVTVVALDTSLSMSAPGQFEKARQLARRAIDKAGGTTSVITFADTATVTSQPSSDSRLARAAIDRARPGVSSTSYRNALNAAANLLHLLACEDGFENNERLPKAADGDPKIMDSVGIGGLTGIVDLKGQALQQLGDGIARKSARFHTFYDYDMRVTPGKRRVVSESCVGQIWLEQEDEEAKYAYAGGV